jgi:RNA polymerase sigma factor (sigma-70 family)
VMPHEMEGITVPNKHIQVKKVEISHLLEYKGRQERLCLPSPSKVAEQEETKSAINSVLPCLNYREREIIKLRYGIGDGFCYTLEECSRIFKVGRERVRQVESKAIRKLNRKMERMKIND